jgi:hypothetical protein
MFISVPDPKFCRDLRLKMSGLRFGPGCGYASVDILRLGPHLVVPVTNTTVQYLWTKLENKDLPNFTLFLYRE